MSAAPIEPPDLISGRGATDLETWELQVPGRIRLDVLKTNRFGNYVEDSIVLGPNRVGYRFQISAEDRRENQRVVVDKSQDPFRNGMLVRFDQDQQGDVETASGDAVTTERALDILDLPEEEFKKVVSTLGEIPVQKIFDLAQSAGVSHSKFVWLKEQVSQRFSIQNAQGEENTWVAETLRSTGVQRGI